jgi:hypothetical protein
VVVFQGKNHAFVPHGSHGITFKDTIAKNTLQGAGDPYWWDNPGTNDNGDNDDGDAIDSSDDIVYDHALVDGAVVGTRGGGFRLGAGDGNVIRDSAAINISGGNSCAAYVWPEQSQGVWVFQNNFASGPCHGIFVWQNDQRIHPIDGFSGDGVDHGAYINHYIYRDLDVPYFNIHASGWRMENSTVDVLRAQRHRNTAQTRFDNVTVGDFIINNASNGGNVPGTYVFNGGNLTCDDITYQSVVSGTTVTIDGDTC